MDKEENKNLNNTRPWMPEPKKQRFMPMAVLLLVMLVCICGIMTCAGYATHSESGKLRRASMLKTAFLYNFIRFVEWPAAKIGDVNEPIIIGVIGEDDFGDALKLTKGKKVRGREVVIKRFKSFSKIKQLDKAAQEKEIKAIGESHLLFVCKSEKAHVSELAKLIQGYHVLTVGDMEDFLNQGGIINFTMSQNKIRFEVNMTMAKDSDLKIRSQLLRLAKTVVRKKIVAADAGGS